MATLISTNITNARKHLRETTASFWSDAELLVHALSGCSDAWRRVVDLHQEHFLTIDITNVTMAADTATLSGIPSNCFRVVSIEARDLTSSSANLGLEFSPRDWNHPDMANARRHANIDPKGQTVYYTVIGQGPPVGTLTVRVAPKVTSAVNLTLAFIPTHGADSSDDNNPIPGESDLALEAWIVAHARAKERKDGSPDPEFMAIYESQMAKILTALTPRQEQELETVEGMFEGYF
jgi:hypothetical protein